MRAKPNSVVAAGVVCLAVFSAPVARAVDLVAVVRDFREEHPDFEDDNGVDPGIVAAELGADGKPVYAGNPTTATTSGREAFDQWYRDVPGVNQSVTIALPLVENGSGLFEFASAQFFPVDDQLFGNEGNPHNFHFTTEVHARFTYAGGETFEFTGDDDVWVFINGRLALDLGGVHGAMTAAVDLDTQAEELGIVPGGTYRMDLFHAERHTVQSNFQVTTTLELVPDDGTGEGEGEGEGEAGEEEEEEEEPELPPPLPEDSDGYRDFPDDNEDGLPDGCAYLDEGGLSCPEGAAPDLDGDGVPDDFDADRDGDGVEDGLDPDRDGDGLADEDDDDLDGDGVVDALDRDVDGDRVPNADDTDVDGDGKPNAEDDDVDGDGVANADDLDADGDGLANSEDETPLGAGVSVAEADNEVRGTTNGSATGGCASTHTRLEHSPLASLAILLMLRLRSARRGHPSRASSSER